MNASFFFGTKLTLPCLNARPGHNAARATCETRLVEHSEILVSIDQISVSEVEGSWLVRPIAKVMNTSNIRAAGSP